MAGLSVCLSGADSWVDVGERLPLQRSPPPLHKHLPIPTTLSLGVCFLMTLAANLRPVAFSVQVQTAPNLPLEREEAGSEGVPRGTWLRGPVLSSHLDPHVR